MCEKLEKYQRSAHSLRVRELNANEKKDRKARSVRRMKGP